MADPAEELRARIRELGTPGRTAGRTPGREGGRPEAIRRFLDGLSHADRVVAIRGTRRGDQRALWHAVERFAPVRLSELVPPERGALQEVRHYGKNTLPAFTEFEKRFCRPAEEDAEKPAELAGFNFQSLAPLTGPGYFVAVPSPEQPDEVWIDYRRVPAAHPEGWPAMRSNERGLARFVYGFMVDTLRRVSEHVTIGSAARHGKDIGSWFLLCRES